MRIAVFGASGRTGRLVVDEALSRGHSVVGVSRRPAPPAESREGLSWVIGDVLDDATAARAIAGCDAVVVAIGPNAPPGEDDARTSGEGTRRIVGAMRDAGVARIACQTGVLIGHPRERLGFLARAMQRAYRRSAPALAADRQAQEDAVTTSGFRHALVRPFRLVDGPAGDAAVGPDVFVAGLASSRRADVARVLVDAVDRSYAPPPAVAVVSAAPRDAKSLVVWTGAYALGEVAGLGVAGLLGELAFGPGGATGSGATLLAAVLAGVVEGSFGGAAQGTALLRWRPDIRLRRWMGATILGVVAGWLLGALPSVLMGGGHAGGASPEMPPRAIFWIAAACLGAVTGTILAAFQARVLRGNVRRLGRWFLANSLGWAVGMPLVFEAVGSAVRGSVALGFAWLAAAGACAGLATGLALRADLLPPAGSASASPGPPRTPRTRQTDPSGAVPR